MSAHGVATHPSQSVHDAACDPDAGGRVPGHRQPSQPVVPPRAMTIRSRPEQAIPELKARIEPHPINQKRFYLNDIGEAPPWRL